MALHSLNGHDPGDKRRSAVVQGWIGNLVNMSPFTTYCYTQKEEECEDYALSKNKNELKKHWDSNRLLKQYLFGSKHNENSKL